MTHPSTYPVSELSEFCKNTDDTPLKTRIKDLLTFKISKIHDEMREKRSIGTNISNAAVSNFKTMLRDIRKLIGIIAERPENLKRVLDSSDLGIDIVDSILKNLTVSKNYGSKEFLKVNAVYLHEFESVIRSGNLVRLLEIADRHVVLNGSDKKLFSDIAKDFPEKTLRDIDEISAITKMERPQLNVTYTNIDRLSETSLKELNHFKRNWMKYATAGTVALVIGTITMINSWFKDALAARRDCWLVKTVNGVSTSCRVSRFTCGDIQSSSGNTVNVKYCMDDTAAFYNITVYFINIVNSDNANVHKVNLTKELYWQVEKLSIDTANLLETKFHVIQNYIETNVKTLHGIFENPCIGTHRDIESGKMPFCRVCDQTADPRSTRFVYPKLVSDKVTFKCVADPSLVDLFTDMAVSTGQNLWNGIVSVSSTVF